jgi:hypothetical protein
MGKSLFRIDLSPQLGRSLQGCGSIGHGLDSPDKPAFLENNIKAALHVAQDKFNTLFF